MPQDRRIEDIEGYLIRAFPGASIQSRVGRMPDSREAHTFRIETGRNTYVLSLCREFIAGYTGDAHRYLEQHRVADVMRRIGSGRIVLTAAGPRSQCAEAARLTLTRKGPGGKTAPLTDDERSRFLEALAEHGNVSYAAQRGGKSRACFYHHRKHDPSFLAAWDAARAQMDGRDNRSTIREQARRIARAESAAMTRRAS
jgi:hypothetical protein